MTQSEIKRILKDRLLQQIDEELANESMMIETARETANADTKSSAGDKFETTRAMMHLEQETYSRQMEETLTRQQQAQSTPIDTHCKTVQVGSVAITSIGNFFIAVSGDDIEIDDEEYTPISLLSPIGEVLRGKSKDDSIAFRGNSITIESLF